MKQNKIEIIQDIRGISALMVVIYHYKSNLTEKDTLKDTIDWLFNAGAAGVDIFFVISGFIMVYCTSGNNSENKTNSSLSFLLRRIIRIWPPYVLISALYFYMAYNHTIIEDSSLAKYFIKSILFLPIALTDAPHYGYPLLPVGWSLSYEMYFYLIFSLSLLFGKYRYFFMLIYFSFTLYTLPYLLNYSSRLDPHQIRESTSLYINFIANPLIWEFIVGMILGIFYSNKAIVSFIRSNSPVWIPYSILLFILWSHISGYLWGHGIKGWGLNASLLLFVTVFYFNKYQSNQFLNNLGTYSYSLYLIHIPVQAFISRLFIKLELNYYLQGQAALILTIGVSLIASYVSYHLIEKHLAQSLLKLLALSNRRDTGTLAIAPDLPQKVITPPYQKYTAIDSDVYSSNH